ncbi:hypothetical protein [Flavobacterium sp. GT3R68]|uniref:hypothetical protein n=1 Tax=Flavobacterium sp. GT3R68 TaxID=2594437 RepID=UPI000F88A77B|nr:hypothetical protein [Flavobacterium sp. GT3R68]RTY96000.1 hypothetical protein EKL32_04970 [Flavobacterium sp. GSN2]TRW93773.1 hypothetical protein FNW07_02360 [Flavobacterium sp. GT3R68]
MKKFLLIILLVFSVSVKSQSGEAENVSSFKITQKTCINKKGNHLRLKKIVSDSRCPEGANCIWAGEVSIIVSYYRDGKFIEDKTIVFSHKNAEENKEWFARRVPEKYQKVTDIVVFPYPKNGNTLNTKKYYVKVNYQE